jgi:hypothetical protein
MPVKLLYQSFNLETEGMSLQVVEFSTTKEKEKWVVEVETLKAGIPSNQDATLLDWSAWLHNAGVFCSNWGLNSVPFDVSYAINDCRQHAFGMSPIAFGVVFVPSST